MKEVVGLVQEYEECMSVHNSYYNDLEGFKKWLAFGFDKKNHILEPEWEGKGAGRGPESVINTMIVRMNRYAKSYSKSAIFGSDFSTQEDFIYLINLKAFGPMTKMELIKKNVQDKPTGIKIIDRLVLNNWVTQTDSIVDKRSKIITVTEKGLTTLEQQMDKIRQASQVVSGNLNNNEKMDLIRLLQKLDAFHNSLYEKNADSSKLLDIAYDSYLKAF